MAKELFKSEEKANEVKALDRTNMNWYHKAGSKKITFCNTIDEIIEGKGETLEIKERIVSTKNYLKDNKIIEQHHLIVFILMDNRIVIVRKHDELK
jgi:hypothetical protein